MVTAWEETQSGDITLYAEGGRSVSTVERAKIVGKDWQETKTLALKYVGDKMAEAIADYFYFKTDQEAIDYLNDVL